MTLTEMRRPGNTERNWSVLESSLSLNLRQIFPIFTQVNVYFLTQERIQAEEKKRREDMELDYLAPFLAKLDNPDRLTQKDAYMLKEDCLADLKQRLIDKANLIQARFEKVGALYLKIFFM